MRHLWLYGRGSPRRRPRARAEMLRPRGHSALPRAPPHRRRVAPRAREGLLGSSLHEQDSGDREIPNHVPSRESRRKMVKTMEEPEITTQPNPIPYKQLMKDGHWLVPVAERPNGWERYGLEEPMAAPVSHKSHFTTDGGSAAGKASREAMTPAERSASAKKAVAVRWSGKGRDEYEKWSFIAAAALELADGASMRVSMLACYTDIRKFVRNLRAALCTRTDTMCVRWHVTFIDDDPTGVNVHRMGDRVTVAGAARPKVTIEQSVEGGEIVHSAKVEKPVAREVHERIEETKTTHRVTIEETPSVVITAETVKEMDGFAVAVSQPAPEAEKRPVKFRLNGMSIEADTAEEARALIQLLPASTPRKRFLESQDERATGKEILNAVIEMFDPHEGIEDIDDIAHEQRWEKLNRLGERARAERDASMEADLWMQTMEVLETNDEKLPDRFYGKSPVWEVLHCLLTEKRLLEFEVFRYCNYLRQNGDPLSADEAAKLLPEAAREKLDKNKKSPKTS
jgi:hypothetical protein